MSPAKKLIALAGLCFALIVPATAQADFGFVPGSVSATALNRNGTIDQFESMIRRQFDTLYAEGAESGRVMAICLHPYLIGVPHRIAGLDSALAYIRSHDRVWFATGEEIVRAWLESGATF